MYTIYLKDLDGSITSYNVIVHGIGNSGFEASVLLETNIVATYLVHLKEV